MVRRELHGLSVQQNTNEIPNARSIITAGKFHIRILSGNPALRAETASAYTMNDGKSWNPWDTE